MSRTLRQVADEINACAGHWHALIRRLDAGEDVRGALAEVERELERLFGEKRWLKAGAVVVDRALIERIQASVRQSRFAGVESYARGEELSSWDDGLMVRRSGTTIG